MEETLSLVLHPLLAGVLKCQARLEMSHSFLPSKVNVSTTVVPRVKEGEVFYFVMLSIAKLYSVCVVFCNAVSC
jgi:hypothetical protein